MDLWAVVECDWNREPFAIECLHQAGLRTYWCHYRTEIAAHPRNGRKPIPVLRGYYPPWLFVAVAEAAPAADIARIKTSRYVSGVLWTETDRHYLPARWLSWIVSGQPRTDRETGEIVTPPACIDPAAGLFEAPYAAKGAGRARYSSGQLVRTVGLWDQFVSVVVHDSGKSIEVEHGQMFGRPLRKIYDPAQVERA